MAKKIKISGEIGWDYTPQTIVDDLRAAKGEDIDVEIATPGGDVFAGIEIYNALRDYKRDNPGAQVMMIAKGLVASMGSYIFMAPADLRTAEDNAVFMVHNPWAFAIGDYREMAKTGDFLAGLAALMSDAYAATTGKKRSEVQALMDAETWLFGDEIKTAGFADEMIPSPEPDKAPAEDKKKKALAAARLRFGAMVAEGQKRADAKANAQKAAAMLSSLPGQSGQSNIQPPAGEHKEETVKSISEFLAQGPEAKAEVDTLKADAAKAAVAAERVRVKALDDARAKYGKVGAIAELIDTAKTDGKAFADIAEQVASLALAASDSAGSINASGDGAQAQAAAEYIPIPVIE
jgi:ATP-dependent protease ClpP protease subunit